MDRNCKKTTSHRWFLANLETFLWIYPNQELFSQIQLYHFSTFIVPNLIQKIRKIVGAISEKTALPTNQPNIKVSDFGLIWRPFANISKSIIFFKNPALLLFYFYSPLPSCKKSEKLLKPFVRKLHYQPANQPNIKVFDFMLIWRHFREYLQIKNFLSKIWLCHDSNFIIP